MNITKLSVEFLEYLSKRPWSYYTILKLSKELNTSYPKAFRTTEILRKQGLVKKEKYGNASSIRINLSDKTTHLLSYIEAEKRERFLQKFVLNIDLSICLVFGSYAKNSQKKGSDIDILLIQNNYSIKPEDFYNKAINTIKTAELTTPVSINPVIITSEEHCRMLKSKESNVAQEALENHIILAGENEYWKEIVRCFQKENW